MLTMIPLSAVLLLPSPMEQQLSPRTAELELLPTTSPQYAGVYHPSYGFRPAQKAERSGPVLIYNNMDLTGYYSVPGVDQEWIDEGQFLSRNADLSEQVNGTSFIYCSAEVAPNGLSAVFRLYDETIVCFGPPRWPTADCSYSIEGLPGGQNGNIACWQIDLDLSGFECDLTTDPNGNRRFGFSSTWENPNTGPWIAEGGLGNHNSMVWFDTTLPDRQSAFRGCWWFGGGPHIGFACAMTGPPAETRAINASRPGIADSLLLTVNAEVQNGNIVEFEVRDRETNTLLPAKMWVSSNQYDHHLLSGPLGLDAHLLAGYVDRIPSNGTRSSTNGIFTTTLAGIPSGVYFTQAATVDARGQPTALSNALRHTVF
jgi:hypothetical protein